MLPDFGVDFRHNSDVAAPGLNSEGTSVRSQMHQAPSPNSTFS